MFEKKITPQQVATNAGFENPDAMMKAFGLDKVPVKHEGYPAGWARVVLMVSPDGSEANAVGGDREPGDGDTAYIGLERMKRAGLLTPNAELRGRPLADGPA